MSSWIESPPIHTQTNELHDVIEQNTHQKLLKGTPLEHRLLKVSLLLGLLLDDNSRDCYDSKHSDDNTSDGTTRKTAIFKTKQFSEGISLEGVHRGSAGFICKNRAAHVIKIFTVTHVVSRGKGVVVLLLLFIL